MYIDSQLQSFEVFWPPILTQTCVRLSRSKWRIDCHYACGAEMTLDDLPDDLIQCLILGAYNSGLTITTSIGATSDHAQRPSEPFSTWRDFQPVFLESLTGSAPD